jgi:ABC-type antimicrobial peptide transport system permease subunit
VITTVCVVLASVGTTIICNILNKNLASEIGASLFVFGIASFVILVLIAIVTTIVATFLPVWNAAKKKPVESIRSL